VTRIAFAVPAVAAVVSLAIGLAYATALGAVAGAVLSGVAAFVLSMHGRRLAGERFGAAAGSAIVLLPLLGILYALPSYRSTYEHDALPALVGATHTAWFALSVALAAALLVAPRQAIALAGVVAAATALAVWGVGPLTDLKNGLHENAWSVTFTGWLVVAGVAGLARRSPWLATGVGGWLVLFVLRGAHKPFAGGAFWQALAPAAPAAALLFVAIALLVPRLRARQPSHAH
jgi:hypothetical protein